MPNSWLEQWAEHVRVNVTMAISALSCALTFTIRSHALIVIFSLRAVQT